MIEFNTPEGMTLPDGATEDTEFDALATLKIGPEGKLVLVAIDGLPVGDTAPAEAPEPGFDDAVMAGMGGGDEMP